jgi:hypothetical protein
MISSFYIFKRERRSHSVKGVRNINKSKILIKRKEITIMTHVYSSIRPKNRSSFYDIGLFQSSYDEVCISLENRLYFDPSLVQFDIPVRPSSGDVLKVNTASIGYKDGTAATLIDYLSTAAGKALIPSMVQKLIFDHPKKGQTHGL